MAHRQQDGAPRRLLENFEERIRPRWVELIDRIDDGDPPTALPGRGAEERHGPAHVIHPDVLVELIGFFVDRALHHQEVPLGLGRDAPRDRMIGVDLQRCRRLHQRGAWIGMSQDETCHAIGERCLADADRTPDQPGVGKPCASIGGKQRALRLGVAVEDAGLARIQRFDAVALVVGAAHDAAPAGKLDTRVESNRSVTVFQMRSATAVFGSVASIAMQRPGSAATISR